MVSFGLYGMIPLTGPVPDQPFPAGGGGYRAKTKKVYISHRVIKERAITAILLIMSLPTCYMLLNI